MPREKRREALDRLRGLTDTELASELAKAREELFELRRKNVTRQLENVAAISDCKRTIARILTLQTERVGANQAPRSGEIVAAVEPAATAASPTAPAEAPRTAGRSRRTAASKKEEASNVTG